MSATKKRNNINITCPYCGTRLSSINKRRCPSCGRDITTLADQVENSISGSEKEDKFTSRGLVFILVLAILFFIGSIIFVSQQSTKSARNNCEANSQVFEEKTKTCRDKTVSERFIDECSDGITIGNKWFSCLNIKEAGLESAYLNGMLIVHGGLLYEKGTYAEVDAGKRAGDYCLSASDAWSHIGEYRCVVFYSESTNHSGRNFFINEKKNYKSGFVVYMNGNYNWNDFYSTYNNKNILVCGDIVTYQGHPEIKTVPKNTMINPAGTMNGSYMVYRYTCPI